MNIILVADVFGKTPALITLAEELNAKLIVDPYNGRNMGFKSEAEAYSYFMDNVGLEIYFSTLLAVTESLSSVSTLVGFSVGASAVWKLSGELSVNNVKRGICYYGSQIRHLKAVSPSFDVALIFPKREDHFDVLALQTELFKKQGVETLSTEYLHGFMNFHSVNYSQIGYIEQLNWLRLNIR